MSDAIVLPDPFTDGELLLRPPTPADVERVTEICPRGHAPLGDAAQRHRLDLLPDRSRGSD